MPNQPFNDPGGSPVDPDVMGDLPEQQNQYGLPPGEEWLVSLLEDPQLAAEVYATFQNVLTQLNSPEKAAEEAEMLLHQRGVDPRIIQQVGQNLFNQHHEPNAEAGGAGDQVPYTEMPEGLQDQLPQQNNAIYSRDIPEKRRKEDAAKGDALPDGSFPIENREDLENAEKLKGKSKHPEAAEALIERKEKEFGVSDKKSKWHIIREPRSMWHISMGALCPHCSKPMVGNDCPSCGAASAMQATDMNMNTPSTGLSPNPDMLPPGNPVSAKWHYAIGEMQQPSGVGTPPPNPEDDLNYLAMDNVAPMSFDEEVAYQKWVDYAVDQLNQGKQPQEILADLQHSGCDDPMAVLERAIQQPLNTDGNLQNVPQEQPPLGENADAMTNNSTSSGAGDTVSQPPAFQAKVKGTEVKGTVEAQWVDLYGREVSRIRTAAGVQDILTENVEPTNQMETDPVNIINELINSVEPPEEKTKASVHAHIEHLKDASRLCRQALYSNITDEQMERIAKIEASTQVAILNLTDELRKLQPSLDDYLASQPTYRHDGYGLEEMLTTETTAHVNTSAYDRLMDEHPKLVVHDLSSEERLDALTVRRAASDYISQYIWELPPKLRTSMTDEFTEATLAEARKFKPEPQQKTASVDEPIENFDGPSAALFI